MIIDQEITTAKVSDINYRSPRATQLLFTVLGEDGLTMFQRAAHEFQISIFQEAKQIFPAFTAYDLKQWADSGIDIKESQGVTPLLIASSTRGANILSQRELFITYLINECKASVNCMNQVSKWTPLHWIARYGDTEICKVMLESGGDPFIPDNNGYFPLDYAGYFQHEMMVKILVEHSIKRFKELVERFKAKKSVEVRLEKIKPSENLFVHSENFLNSPFYATRLLFWACHCQSVVAQDVKFILDEMESYPEAQISIFYDQTSIHAAAACGDMIKLNHVCVDYYNRHQAGKAKFHLGQKIIFAQKHGQKKKKSQQQFTRKPMQLPQLDYELTGIMGICSLRMFKANAITMWKNLTLTFRESVSFNVQDFQGNTPLHLSSLNNKVECAKLLLEQYGCYVDIKNKQGIMTNGMGNWHPKIKQLYSDFYLKIDRMLADGGQDQDALKTLGGSKEDVDSKAFWIRAISNKRAQMHVTKDMLRSRPHIPYSPPVALKFKLRTKGCCGSKPKRYTEQMNALLRELDSSDFIIRIFKGINEDEYIVTLDLKIEHIMKEMFENQKYLKLQYFNASVAFREDLREKLMPLMSKDIQKCIMTKFDRLFDVKSLKKNCGLISIYPLHDNQGLNYIEQSNVTILKSIKAYMTEGTDGTRFSYLVSIRHYFGSKNALLTAFFEFQSIWLFLPSLFALGITIYQLTESPMLPRDFTLDDFNQKQLLIQTPKVSDPAVVSDPMVVDPNTLNARLLSTYVCAWFDLYHCAPQIQSTQINVLFAIVMTFWCVIGQELWKRKMKQIEYVFGMLGTNTQQLREDMPNPDYIGQNKFSWLSFHVTKDSHRKMWGYFYYCLTVFISLALIGCTIVAYYFLKKQSTGIMQGIYLSLITTATSYIFMYSMIYLEKKVNFRLLKDRNKFYITQSLAFRLFNINIPVVYALIYEPPGMSIDEKYSAMYTLIIGLVGTKVVSVFISRYFFRWCKFALFKAFYFSKVQSLAKKQAESYSMTNPTLNNQERDALNKRLGLQIFKNVLPSVNSEFPELTVKNRCGCITKPKNVEIPKRSVLPQQQTKAPETIELTKLVAKPQEQSKKQPKKVEPLCYQRLVVNNLNEDNDCIENIQIDIDAIEINSRMPFYDDYSQINDLTEKYNILACGLFYCGICPIATFIVMVFFVLDSLFQRLCNCYIMQRRLTEAEKDLGTWNAFADTVVVFTIVTNSLLLLVSDSSYNDVIKTFGDTTQSGVKHLWIVVGIEHLILLLLILIRAMVPDISYKLRMCLHRTAFELEKLGMFGNGQGNAADKARIAELEAKVKSLETKAKNEHERALEIIQYHEKGKSQISVRKGRLAEFLEIDPRQWDCAKIMDACEESLITNMEFRLFRETFVIIERSIIQRKLNKIMEANKMLTVICVECQSVCADTFCGDCNDHYCRVCFLQIHKNRLYAKHQQRNLNLNPTDAIKPSLKTTNALTVDDAIWVKFEYFNFPTEPSNDLYRHLQVHFENLKKAYVKFNYIDEITGQLDLASVFVDQNYDGIERELARTMLSDHTKKFGRRSVVAQKEIIDGGMWFNDEELYYLNRVAYHLFRKWGSKLRFDQFISEINKLQSAQFDTRLTVWLSIVQELEEDVKTKYKVGVTADINLKTDFITRVKFGNVVRASYPQHVEMKKSFEKVVDQIYNSGLDSTLSVDQLYSNIKSKPDALALMHCILQWRTGDASHRSVLSTTENQV